jgi:hypothetical protein
MRTMRRAISPAVSTMLLITVAVGAVVTVAAYTHQSSSIATRNIDVTVDGLSFSRARSDTNVWLFSMSLRNTGTIPVAISGTVTGSSVNQNVSYDTLDPGSKGVLSYVWSVNAAPGEIYIVNFVATGSEGSTKRYVASVTADG